jgi:beta-mannosidase
MDNVEVEIRENVKRMRNHPSIVVWAGNNEILEGWNNWGW